MTAAEHPSYDQLRPHQQGLADLLAQSNGEESLPLPIGWGKTPTLIVAAETALTSALPASDARLLIVTNKVTCQHWLETWKRFSSWFTVSECVGPPTDNTVLVTSYENFSRHAAVYLSVPWTRVILDEAPPATPSNRQRALLQLRAKVPCWLTSQQTPKGAPLTAALTYLLGDVSLPPYLRPGPRSRPSLLAELVA